MERNFYRDEFETMLKDRSDEFRMYPSRRVWHSIYNDLHPSRKWPSMAMSLVLIVVLVMIGYLNTGDTAFKKAVPSLNDESLAVNSVPQQNTANHHKSGGGTTTLNNNPASFGSDDNYENTATASSAYSPAYANDLNTATGNKEQTASQDLAANAGSALSIFTLSKNNTTGDETNAPGNAVVGSTAAANAVKNRDVVAEMDNYINSNQLLADVAYRNRNKAKISNSNTGNGKTTAEVSTEDGLANNTDAGLSKDPTGNSIATTETDQQKKADPNKNSLSVKSSLAADNDPRPWMEDYALHNKTNKRNWRDYVNTEFYFTPSLGYRKLQNDGYPMATSSGFSGNAVTPATGDVNNAVSHRPSLNLEAGVALVYAASERLRVKAGLQFNYTSYGIDADRTTHPAITSLTLNSDNGYSYMATRTSTLSNTSTNQPVRVHNNTFQVSVPLGLSVKLAGNNKLQWFLGGSFQPTYVLGGKANLISSDYQNYVSESSMLRKWNFHYGVETYVMYKWDGYTIQLGPQYRYQLLSTYNKKYAVKENLYNAGLKFGVIKNF